MTTLRRVLAGVLLLAAAAWAGEPAIRAVDAVDTTVSDMDAAVAFYASVLDCTPVRDVQASGVRRVRLQLGAEHLDLTAAPSTTPPARVAARSDDRGFQHVAIVVRDMDAAYARLRAHHVAQVSPAPQRIPDTNPTAGGIRALYFRDPDGHPLELIWYPPGRGDPRWQAATDRLFLGIDHTALVVADTDASVAFYRDRLGLRVVGGSENTGVEQERLSGVPGARVRITSLRAAAGPGIELLEYLAPPAARAAYGDAGRVTRLVAADPGPPRPVGARDPGRVALRDPDGHALEIVTP